MVTVRMRASLLDRFELVLVLVLTSIVAQSLVDVRASYGGQLVTHAVTGIALVVATRASGARRRARRVMDLLVVVTLAANLLLAFFQPDLATTANGWRPDALWAVAAAITPVLIARRLVLHDRVRLQTVLGAVAAYLQIAVAYALLFQTIDGFTGTYFFGRDVPTTTYTYFSLTTITTLGYGDFTAVTNVGRLAAMSEAVIGQVYLVTFVAMIVSRFAAASRQDGAGSRHQRARRAAEASRTPQQEPDSGPDAGVGPVDG